MDKGHGPVQKSWQSVQAQPAPLEGSGANGVLLYFANGAEQTHWMVERLLKRAALDRQAFRLAAMDTVDPLALPDLVVREGLTVVVPMGGAALRAVLHQPPGDLLRWFLRVVPYGWATVVPCLAPSMLLPFTGAAADDQQVDDLLNEADDRLLHPPRYTMAAMLALRRAVDVAAGTYSPADIEAERRFLRDPQPAVFAQWARQALALDAPLAFDIETNYHLKRQEQSDSDLGLDKDNQIIRISFAYAPGHAVSVPFEGHYLGTIAELLGSSAEKIGWNSWQFDQPMLLAAGYPLGGVHHDAQDAWHLFQSDLPKGLESVSAHYCPRQRPWKHLGSDPGQAAEYSCIDADITWRIWAGLRRDLERAGQWDFWLEQVQLMPLLREAGRRGIVIDTAKQAALRADFEVEIAQVLRELQGHVPPALFPSELRARPTEREGWAWLPAESTTKVLSCVDCGKIRVNKKHACKVAPGVWKMGHVELPSTKYRPTLLSTASPDAVRDWVRDWGFNPGSTEQLRAYARMRGHELGYNPKTGQESLDTKQLERLARQHGDAIYEKAVLAKKIGKALSTYVDSITPRADGRVGTLYVNAPSTWRLCIAQGTPIEVVRDLDARPTVPIEEVKAGDLVLTFDKDLRLTTRKVLWAGQTGVKQVVRVHWESGYGNSIRTGYVDVTPEHRMRLVDGTYKQAKDLVPQRHRTEALNLGRGRVIQQGDRLLACTRRMTAWGYSRLYTPTGPRNGEFEHKVVAGVAFGRRDVNVHHRNGNKVDNRPENLEVLCARLHGGLTGAANGKAKRGAFRDHLAAHLMATQYPYAVKWCGYAPGPHLEHNHRVTKVEWLEGAVPVYDLEVEETENFIAGEVCVHNSSRYPNLQNQPKRGGNKWAKQARAMFVPSPGHVFVQADYSAIEAVLVGWFMGDADYISLAKKSIHAYVCALELGWVKSPADFTPAMGAEIKETKKDLYDRIKTVVHGSNYGMSPYLMWKSMETMFPTLALAQQSQDALFRALPGLKAWQFDVRARAQKEAYLENPWGVRHYFFDVFTWAYDGEGRLQHLRDGSPKVKPGKDSKRATAFLPQSSAGCVMRDTLRAVGESWLRPFMPAAVSVHDSILLDVPRALAERAAADLVSIMTRPIEKLNGLQIGVEVEQGENWLDMVSLGVVPMLDGQNGLVSASPMAVGA